MASTCMAWASPGPTRSAIHSIRTSQLRDHGTEVPRNHARLDCLVPRILGPIVPVFYPSGPEDCGRDRTADALHDMRGDGYADLTHVEFPQRPRSRDHLANDPLR